MNIIVEIPDTIAGALAGEGRDPARAVLEAIAIEGYRTDRLSEYEVQQLLGFEYFEEVHRFFKEHDVPPHYSIEDWEHDLAEARRYPQLQASENRAG
jgi:Uncharacterised protein family (UPF0175)